MWMVNIVKAVTAFHTQTTMVSRSVTALNVEDFVVFDVVSELATDTTVWADRIDFFIRLHHAHIIGRHQSPCRTGFHTLATGDTGAFAHGVIQVKYDFSMMTAHRQANNIVILFIAAGPHTACALNTGIHIDRNRRVRQIGLWILTRFETRGADVQFSGPVVEFGVQGVRLF